MLAGLIALGQEREQRLANEVEAEALRRSNELTTALLRTVSHDFRSPLTAISTAAEGLRFADLDGEERELLDTIADQSGRLSRLVTNLLDLSRLEAGAATPAAEWVDVRDLIDAAVADVTAAVARRDRRRPRRRAAARAGRRRPAAAGAREPGRERRQVLAARRARARGGGGPRRPGRRVGVRSRPGRARVRAGAHLPAVLPRPHAATSPDRGSASRSPRGSRSQTARRSPSSPRTAPARPSRSRSPQPPPPTRRPR